MPYSTEPTTIDYLATGDEEVDVIQICICAIGRLDPTARERVASYIIERYQDAPRET